MAAKKNSKNNPGSYSQPKKSFFLRLIILIVAEFMFAGAVIMPFIYY